MKTRKHRTSLEKASFVLLCLTGKKSVSENCREHNISTACYYSWRKAFIAGGTKALERAKLPPRSSPNKSPNNIARAEEKMLLLEAYSSFFNSSLPELSQADEEVKNKIINLIEDTSLSKSLALRLVDFPKSTYYSWKRIYMRTGNATKPKAINRTVRLVDQAELIEMVFKVLHAPPIEYGFNRTTWKFIDLQKALHQSDCCIGRHTIREIVKNAGYRWMKARKVLTSKDPDYRNKLDNIQQILSNLILTEGFFSIDEYGPFAVKHRQGKMLVAPGDVYSVPQWQKSKGAIIMTAALELSSNQVTHFYSKKKNTAEMIKLLDILLKQYSHLDRIFLSWDAASWHISKVLMEKIEINNAMARETGNTFVEIAPLPAGAQFLNVIEAVFSGMSRAVIHNSNYPSTKDAKKAINRYFLERNKYFKKKPRKAGKKIWGKEDIASQFSEGHNCKDRRYCR